MLRSAAVALSLGILICAGCGHSAFAVRPVPKIAADNVGKPVSRLQEAFGDPRKIDQTSTKWVYVWFFPQKPARRSGGLPRLRDGSHRRCALPTRVGIFPVEHRMVRLPRGGT